MLISSSKVIEKAMSAGLVAGVDVMEVTDCGMVVGIRIGEKIVSHNGGGLVRGSGCGRGDWAGKHPLLASLPDRWRGDPCAARNVINSTSARRIA